MRKSVLLSYVGGLLIGLLTGFPATVAAQVPQARIAGAVSNASRRVLQGSRSPLARAERDLGRMDTATKLDGMQLVFARSAAQEADLQQLLAAQQDPASAQYHAWLTPEQFGARFGMPDGDLAKAGAWLVQQGFTVNGVSNARDRISFSGTAAQAEAAFGMELHNFTIGGETRFAPSGDISLPAALASVTQAVTNLSSIRPRPHLRKALPAPQPNFTSSQTGSHFLAPGDIATIYDVKPVYNAGYTGTGQSIAVVGQSAIVNADIEHFQSAAGLPVKDPTIVLVPNTGTSAIYTGEESESDLDVEFSGAMAPGATIRFVYSGNSQNSSVVDAERYAIDNNVASIVSISYGLCEFELGATEYAAENAVFAQAAAQGQTVVAAAGDAGSSDCVASNVSGLYADFPASSQYVTGLGGTEFSAVNTAIGNTSYWASANGSDAVASALSYIPEQAWNDSTTNGLSSGGGGASMFTTRPTWQTGVPGIAAGNFRLVPDLALTSSPTYAPYLYCSSDFGFTKISGSCSNGFRDANNSLLTAIGGTSAAAPTFAGIVALLNQATGASQGQINARLYAVAANSGLYGSAFHDIIVGNNACTPGYLYCAASAANSFAAGAGYDEATGLGSIDANNLLTAFRSGAGAVTPLLASVTALSAATLTPAAGASDAIAINVTSGTSASTATPTGNVSVILDGGNATLLALTGGTAAFPFSSTTGGAHTVAVTYSGDGTFASSTSTLTLTVPGTAAPASSFTVSAANVSVTAGSSGTSSVVVTPANGYTGTVSWAVSAPAGLSNACYSIGNAVVSGTAAVTTTLTVYTSSSACTALMPLSAPGKHAFARAGGQAVSSVPRPAHALALAWLLAGAFGLCGLRSRRSIRLAVLFGSFVLMGMLSGCGGGGTVNMQAPTTTSTNAPTGTYALTLTGTDSASASLTAKASFNLTVN